MLKLLEFLWVETDVGTAVTTGIITEDMEAVEDTTSGDMGMDTVTRTTTNAAIGAEEAV